MDSDDRSTPDPVPRRPVGNKGITMAELEPEWLGLGGSVVRDKPGHVLFKHPSLPTSAVHAPRSTGTQRAPKHLVSRLLKLRAGRVMVPPRPVELEAKPDPMPTPERPRGPQRASPATPLVLPPANTEAPRVAADAIAERKARDRATMLDRLFEAPVVERATPTTWGAGVPWKVDGIPWADGRDTITEDKQRALMRAALAVAEQDAMVWIFGTAMEWRQALEPFLTPPMVERALSTALDAAQWIVAIVKNGAVPSLANHTYAGGAEHGGLPVGLAVVTVSPAVYARFRVSWASGYDYLVAQCRQAGLVLDGGAR